MEKIKCQVNHTGTRVTTRFRLVDCSFPADAKSAARDPKCKITTILLACGFPCITFLRRGSPVRFPNEVRGKERLRLLARHPWRRESFLKK